MHTSDHLLTPVVFAPLRKTIDYGPTVIARAATIFRNPPTGVSNPTCRFEGHTER